MIHNEEPVKLDWHYDIWPEIEIHYPLGTSLNCKVTQIKPNNAWLKTEDGLECFLRKWQVQTLWQITDLCDELNNEDIIPCKIIGYNKDDFQLLVSSDITSFQKE